MNRPGTFTASIVIVLAALLAAAVALIVACLFGHFADLLVQLAATGIGTILALAVGLFVFEWQVRKNRKDLRNILRAELNETIYEVERTKANLYAEDIDTGLIYIQPLVIEHAAKSGEFSPAFVEDLLSAARQFHTYNIKVSRLSAILIRTGKVWRHQLTECEAEEIERVTETVAGNADEVKKRRGKLLQNENLQ